MPKMSPVSSFCAVTNTPRSSSSPTTTWLIAIVAQVLRQIRQRRRLGVTIVTCALSRSFGTSGCERVDVPAVAE